MERLRRVVALATLALGVIAMAIALAACGGSGTESSGSTSASTDSTGETAASGGGESCGAVPTKAPSDPDGVLAEFPEDVQAAYNLYSAPVLASAWADWKPEGGGPYTIAISAGEFVDPFAAQFTEEIKALQKESDVVKELKFLNANVDVQTQIQQIRQAVREKVDLMIVFQLSPAADAAVLKEAGEAGIPVIAPLNASNSPYVVGINGNEVLKGATLMGGLAPIMGETGSLLEMQGYPGIPANDEVLEGISEVLKDCSDIEVVGKPVGQFVPSTAKTQALQFLAAHPQPLDGVIQLGGMATGIIQAFEQTGREVPPIGDLGATPGALAYWSEHQDSYEAVALASPVGPLTQAIWQVAAGMLEGRGMTVSEILQTPILITEENLEEWVDPEWTLTTPLVYAPGPSGVFYPPEYVEQFFADSTQ